MRLLSIPPMLFSFAFVLNGQGWVVKHLEAMDYPALPAAARAVGEIVVRCRITENGAVSSAEVVSETGNSTGLALLGDAARENARKWGFQRSRGAKAGPSAVTLIYTFHLEGDCQERPCATKFMFDFPNRVTVIGEYRSLSSRFTSPRVTVRGETRE
jgi:TonB family protein